MTLVKGGVPVLKSRVVRFQDWVADIKDIVLRRRDAMTPPRRLGFIGGGDFISTGKSYLQFFVDICDLSPEGRVLDVGCGVGRMAVPLTRYISPQGSYCGFDIVKPGIDWCTRRITAKFPNFTFAHADIHNNTYNPAGRLKPAEYQFPYDNNSFDLVFLTSVFTHMLPSDVEHYLSEIVRVLKPGKSCCITYFLLNQRSRELLAGGQSLEPFRYDAGGCLSISKDVPESAVAYDEAFILGLYAKYGLDLVDPIRYGSWSGDKYRLRYQDVVVAKKLG